MGGMEVLIEPIFSDEDRVTLMALNNYAYCPRRCALVHLEGYLVHNIHTLEGIHGHQRSDEPMEEWQGDVRVVRALPLWSDRLGLSGKADMVEFHNGIPYPVEQKRGRRKQWDNDDIQLCAQGLCLEEMTGESVPRGAIFHVKSRRRREVVLDDNLRELTCETISAVRELIRGGASPAAVLHRRCDGCSVRSLCMPELTSTRSMDLVDRWSALLAEEDSQP